MEKLQSYINGHTHGTGAALAVPIGFTPKKVKVWNPASGQQVEWVSEMGTTYGGIKTLNDYQLTSVLTSARPAIGSTPANVASVAFDFELAGVRYNKAAVAAGTALTATTCAHDDAHAHFACFGFEIGTDGTIANLDATANNTGYASEALAIAAIPAATASHVLFMYITVEIPASGTDFVGATTSLASAVHTVRYYDVVTNRMTSAAGISLYAGVSGTTAPGFYIGTDSSINYSGDTLYYEAWG